MNWNETKERLSISYPWLAAFAQPIEFAALAKVHDVRKNNLRYEHLLVEPLLRDISALIERCLAYRREARDLEIAAVRTCLEYEEFLERSKLDEELELLGLRTEQLSAEERFYAKASMEFGKSDHPLETGHRELTTGQSSIANLDIADADTRKKLISARWALTKRIKEEYQRRHTEPGNSHNYRWRMERIVELFAEDLSEAYQKAQAVSGGIKIIYDRESAPPEPSANNIRYLDDFVGWTRDTIRYVEYEAQYETEYEIVIPLVQQWRWDGSPIIEARAFKERFKKGASDEQTFPLITLAFNLQDVFHHQERVRVNSIGLTYATDFVNVDGIDANMAKDSYSRIRATIRTPEQESPWKKGEKYRKPPVILGSVSVYSGNTPLATESGPIVYNINPLGDWEIALEPLVAWKDKERLALYVSWFNNSVEDLKLHLRVVSKPNLSMKSAFRP